MKKSVLILLFALIGISLQLCAADIVNNTNCGVSVRIVFYNSNDCSIINTCTTLSVPAHGSVTIPPCISSTVSLRGFEICWSPAVCINCATIGNFSGPHPCADFPFGPVPLGTGCSECTVSPTPIFIHWSVTGDLIVG